MPIANASPRAYEPGPPRLLVLTPNADRYGSDRMLLAALPALSAEFAITVGCPGVGASTAAYAELGAEVVPLGDFALARRSLSPRALPGYVARARRAVGVLDAMHQTSPFAAIYSNTLAVGIGGALRRRWACPHILHAHECPLRPAWLTRLLLADAARSTDRLILNSRYTRDLIAHFSPRLAVRGCVVPNGVDFPERLAIPSVHAEPLRVSFVARIHPKKGHRVLLAALDLARARGTEVELHCFGDSLAEHHALERNLRAFAVSYRFNVTWHGYVEGDRRYRGFDLAVVPSVVPEEFSLVTAEAQAIGLPVIATGPGGPSEIMNDGITGIIVPPGSAGALADALVALDRNRHRLPTMGRAGAVRVRAEFSRDRFAARVVSVVAAEVGIDIAGAPVARSA